MKIAFFTENWTYGGNSIFAEDLISSYNFKECKLELYLNNEAKINKKKFPKNLKLQRKSIYNFMAIIQNFSLKYVGLKNLHRFFFFLKPLTYLINLLNNYILIKKKKFDLVIIFNGGYPASDFCLSAIRSASLLEIPTILVIAGTPLSRRILAYPYEVYLDKMISKHANLVIANSNYQISELIKLRNVDFSKTKVLHNGIKISKYPKAKKYVKKDYITIGVACRLDKDKDIISLISACKFLSKNKIKYKLIIIGDGPERFYLERFVKREKLISKNIKFKGYVKTNLDRYISKFDIYVFPSLNEGMPYSILEAAKNCVPIITTDAGGISEFIIHKKTGIVIKKQSPEDIADAIVFIMKNPSIALKLVENSYQLLKNKFDIKNMRKEFREISNSMVKNHK